jgi:hypothetical protein
LGEKVKSWRLITTLKEREMRNLKQAAKDQRERGCRVRGIPDEADLELLRAAKKQRWEERKLEIIQGRQEKAYNAELKRLKQATARKACRCTKETSKGAWTFYPRCGKGLVGQMS